MLSAKADNIHTKAEFIVLLFIQNISKFLTSLPPHVFQNLGLFLSMISGYKQMFFLVDTPG